MSDLILDAIRQKRTLTVSYPPGIRNIEPHTYGYGSEGQVLLRAYQTDGASESGEHKNWKLFRCERFLSIERLGQTFAGPRSGYRRADSVMKGGIIAEL